MSKLTKEQKDEIVARYQLHLANTPQKLQEEFGISYDSFWRVVSPNRRKQAYFRNEIYVIKKRISEGRVRDVATSKARIKELEKKLKELQQESK